MNERAIFAIEEYMYDLFEPGSNWPPYEIRKRSYERWAAAEILKRIKEQPNQPAIKVVEDFVCKTAKYHDIEHDDKNDGYIFYVAHDVATDILDILRAMD